MSEAGDSPWVGAVGSAVVAHLLTIHRYSRY
jgi:hypothetical protein